MGRASDLAKIELWRERLGRYESAGLTVAEFCRFEHVSVPSFYQWRKKFRKELEGSGEHGVDRQSTFVPVRLRQFSHVEVELVNGVSLRLPAGDLETLKAIILIAGQLPAPGNPRGRVAVAEPVDDPRAKRSDQRVVRSC